MGFQGLFFSMEGRIGRGTYWISVIGITVVSFVAGLILWRIFGERLILTGGGAFRAIRCRHGVALSWLLRHGEALPGPQRVASLALACIGVMAVKAVPDLFHVTGDP